MNKKLALSLFLLCLFTACGQSEPGAKGSNLKPEPFDTEECHVCSMVVREQPAPRGQLIHRDGTRLYFCSISGMIQHMHTPSPHGKIEMTWVEIAPADISPQDMSFDPKPWWLLEDSFFVTGIKRKGTMGKPIMCFGGKQEALNFSQAHSGHFSTIEDLNTFVNQ